MLARRFRRWWICDFVTSLPILSRSCCRCPTVPSCHIEPPLSVYVGSLISEFGMNAQYHQRRQLHVLKLLPHTHVRRKHALGSYVKSSVEGVANIPTNSSSMSLCKQESPWVSRNLVV